MAAPNKGRRPAAGGQSKPGRALAFILIAMVALTGGMFISHTTTPRLGIDLAGGTSITLKAKPEPGQKSAINKKNMDTAVEIMNRRVNGLGVTEAEVQTQGSDNIIVNIPKGTDSEQARQQVGQTAKLYFRPVLTAQPAAAPPTPSGTPSPSGKATPTPSGKTTPSPTGKATPSATGKPSATGTPQGRALTDALKASGTPTPGASKPPTPAPNPTGAGDSAAAAKLQAQFASLDCTTKEARSKAGEGAKSSEPTVACDKDGQEKYILGPAEVDGTDVAKAQAVINQQNGQWIVQMDFTGGGSKKFAAITGKLSQQQYPNNRFAIALDNQVVSAPTVSSTLSGSAEISGNFTQSTAQDLANVLSYGALPLSFTEQSVSTVTAALGADQLHAGLIAGAIGLALVVIYLVAYYRGLATIAILSLVVSAILTYTIMTLLGSTISFALNLPAVCGAIVAIGITADSFIVYFERIRDEIREGRTLRPAVERAWPRARRTILVSDFVSFLAAAVLFIVTVGKVQGFAFTLGLTTLLDVVVVFLFTKPVMTLLARRKFFASGHPWSGLDPKRLGAKPPLRRARRTTSAPVDNPKEA
ncbi:protein translocase subunit SecD [Streptomyces sp. ASQP_92]|uniref:protein translocase subunit SecD n=1 Tax=unclassified Streptomyces TaxID=2593676 RepID=UPI0021BFDE62|nr:protein translocase subunit SecD [Streptomyces sp. ASQP_92]MCT9092102.1 protein translocase subunit SecD [Streptomyces sp. ASQP_92]